MHRCTTHCARPQRWAPVWGWLRAPHFSGSGAALKRIGVESGRLVRDCYEGKSGSEFVSAVSEC
eukprot:1139454-Pelagomonas_calceolata.AAC.1